MSFRIEQKFRLTDSGSRILRASLQKKGMRLLFPSRTIESTYFDTKSRQMYKDSEEGSLPRKKIRIRHYPGEDPAPQLEIKTSSQEGRFKTTQFIDDDERAELLRNGYVDPMYGQCRPVAVISYDREYFSFKDVRITFDSDICYWKPDVDSRIREFEAVCEIKAPAEASLDFLAQVIPHPTSRFSKYARACQSIR